MTPAASLPDNLVTTLTELVILATWKDGSKITHGPNFEEYMGQVGKLSEVERTMIKRLWEEGESDFPRGWVRSSELLTDTEGRLDRLA
jgi:hypothetical protein